MRAILVAILMKHVRLFISQNKDDHLNEFLSSLGDPSSPVIEDFDFTSGKNQVFSFLLITTDTVLRTCSGIFSYYLFSSLLPPLSRFRLI